MTPLATLTDEILPKWRTLDSSAFLPSIDADLQRFFNEYFVDTDSDDDDVEFEGFNTQRY